jgi:protein-S-isoprenylcysteine O-methyltransferase Ste14
MSRFFEWFPFGVLACWGFLGLTRAFRLHARGIRVITADRQRTLLQKLADLLALVCLLVWTYEIVAYAWRFQWHIGPVGLHRVLVDNIATRTLGALILCAAVVLYGQAVNSLGTSWRLGIDRATPGPLVTRGVYRWIRHPIYAAFDLLFAASFLVLGRLIFLVLAFIWLPLMHCFMVREERFLAELYDGPYRDYCRGVGRYFPWRKHG